jgi:hypothetical protein
MLVLSFLPVSSAPQIAHYLLVLMQKDVNGGDAGLGSLLSGFLGEEVFSSVLHTLLAEVRGRGD